MAGQINRASPLLTTPADCFHDLLALSLQGHGIEERVAAGVGHEGQESPPRHSAGHGLGHRARLSRGVHHDHACGRVRRGAKPAGDRPRGRVQGGPAKLDSALAGAEDGAPAQTDQQNARPPQPSPFEQAARRPFATTFDLASFDRGLRYP